MSKSRNRKWYDFDDDMEDYKKKKKGDDRRSKKKMKNQLRAKNFSVSYEQEDDYK